MLICLYSTIMPKIIRVPIEYILLGLGWLLFDLLCVTNYIGRKLLLVLQKLCDFNDRLKAPQPYKK